MEKTDKEYRQENLIKAIVPAPGWWAIYGHKEDGKEIWDCVGAIACFALHVDSEGTHFIRAIDGEGYMPAHADEAENFLRLVYSPDERPECKS
jgi:hypothetical protein